MIKKRKGFTLIELMIVVGIIGILAAVAIPKFADLIKRSRESKTKHNLGAIRSALSIYYSNNESTYPIGTLGNNQPDLENAMVPEYMVRIPESRAYPNHSKTFAVDNIPDGDPFAADPTDDGTWAYTSVAGSDSWGSLVVECYHADSKGEIWSSY